MFKFIKKQKAQPDIELRKAWKMIEKLEADNSALAKGNTNALTALKNEKYSTNKQITNLKVKNKKLESDNKFLKQMVLKANHLNASELEKLLGKLFAKGN